MKPLRDANNIKFLNTMLSKKVKKYFNKVNISIESLINDYNDCKKFVCSCTRISICLIMNKHEFIREILLSHLKLPKDSSGAEISYCYLNDITHRPTCVVCKTNKVYFKDYNKGYKQTCSIECSKKYNLIKPALPKSLKSGRVSAICLECGDDIIRNDINNHVQYSHHMDMATYELKHKLITNIEVDKKYCKC